MKKFKLTHLIGMVLLSWSASPAVKAVQPDYKYGDLRVTEQNTHREVIIDKATFDSLPVSKIVTSTPWQKKSTFSGVSFSDILKYAGMKGSRLKVHALNDYWVEIPMSDVVNYNILLASKIDGKDFSIRDFGPYFVIYPVDERREELNSPVKFSKFVWQVDSITVVDK
ncbi:TPA: molybdopterin-dependent oxidoreductase [Klebsiella pneumoniae]|uniref:Oxidoreductase n=1 Tax=Klebsiella michiganensis TaxID=1134687 RepID=A0A2J5A201_9ENTR|nr:molybdopterin-dependent oxidoreductase [Klebsiella pneumoniae]PLM69296.1 oxidoreductase [Klebsiella michiganensis]RRF57878.1 oxidoreductase [Klebsiella pneumoniae]HBS4005834.1 molybdopterin-dependent oxidoreductase [Klebsiella pneumoniae]HCK0334642.1 molybdopterin-dependent oxidoreductase [Klebsiella pneumoniae]HDH0429150.1 molybdopterin-dependent oxidoreductase [Klebsiella pneumoniae]